MKYNKILNQDLPRSQYNSYGYRSVEPRPHIPWALGCSQTFGWCVDIEQIWTTYLSDMIGSDIINFGVPAGGVDTMHRIVDAWYEELKPDIVFIQLPYAGRYEIDGQPNTKLDEQRREKEIIQYDRKLEDLLDKIDNYITIELHDYITDKASDNLHMGPNSHLAVARELYNRYNPLPPRWQVT